jgi:hypothetical protein
MGPGPCLDTVEISKISGPRWESNADSSVIPVLAQTLVVYCSNRHLVPSLCPNSVILLQSLFFSWIHPHKPYKFKCSFSLGWSPPLCSGYGKQFNEWVVWCHSHWPRLQSGWNNLQFICIMSVTILKIFSLNFQWKLKNSILQLGNFWVRSRSYENYTTLLNYFEANIEAHRATNILL